LNVGHPIGQNIEIEHMTAKISQNSTPIGNGPAFVSGMLAALSMPFWMVVGAMIGFGSLVQAAGFGLEIGIGSTLGIWGLPGQVAMIELFVLSAPLLAIITTSSMANLRFMPMVVVMMPLFKGDPRVRRWRYLMAQALSINIWTVTMSHCPDMPLTDRLPFFVGVSVICLLGGVIGTSVGFVLAGTMPVYVTLSLVFLNPAYFVFVFSSVRARNCIIAVIFGAIAGPLVHLISPDWGVPITGIVAGTAAFFADRLWKPSTGARR
jgi:predicted branched-subunit amino acid permease